MSPSFFIIALLTLASAVAAMTLRNLVHCALAVAVTFAGLAACYLGLGAQFVGFAQILVYVGAVAILIVFAILLTRRDRPAERTLFSSTWLAGLGIAVGVAAVLAGTILASPALIGPKATAPEATVREIGEQLMTKYILPLEVIGLLLTVAMIGAVIIAMSEKETQ